METNDDPALALLGLIQDHVQEFGLEGVVVTKGVTILEIILPDGMKTYRVFPVGDCRTWDARGLMGEALSDMDSRNAAFWLDMRSP